MPNISEKNRPADHTLTQIEEARKLNERYEEIDAKYGTWLKKFNNGSSFYTTMLQDCMSAISDRVTQYRFKEYLLSLESVEESVEDVKRLFTIISVNPQDAIARRLSSSAKKLPNPEQQQLKAFQEWVCGLEVVQQESFNAWMRRKNRDDMLVNTTTFRTATDAKKQRTFLNWFDREQQLIFDYFLSKLKPSEDISAKEITELKKWYKTEYPQLIRAAKDKLLTILKSNYETNEKFFGTIADLIKIINEKKQKIVLQFPDKFYFDSTATAEKLYNQWLDQRCWEKHQKRFLQDPADIADGVQKKAEARIDDIERMEEGHNGSVGNPLNRTTSVSLNSTTYGIGEAALSTGDASAKLRQLREELLTEVCRLEILDKTGTTVAYVHFTPNDKKSLVTALEQYGMVCTFKGKTNDIFNIEQVRIHQKPAKGEEPSTVYNFNHKTGKLAELLTSDQAAFLTGNLDDALLEQYIKENPGNYRTSLFLAVYGYYSEAFYWGFDFLSRVAGLAIFFEVLNISIGKSTSPASLTLNLLLSVGVVLANITYDPAADAKALCKKLMLRPDLTFFEALVGDKAKKNPLMTAAFAAFGTSGALPDLLPVLAIVNPKTNPALFGFFAVSLILSSDSYYFSFNFADVMDGTKVGIKAFMKALHDFYSEETPEDHIKNKSASARTTLLHMTLAALFRAFTIAYGPYMAVTNVSAALSAEGKPSPQSVTLGFALAVIGAVATLTTVPATRWIAVAKTYYPQIGAETWEQAVKQYNEFKENNPLTAWLQLKQDPSTFLVGGLSYAVPAYITMALDTYAGGVAPSTKIAMMAVLAPVVAKWMFDGFAPAAELKAINAKAKEIDHPYGNPEDDINTVSGTSVAIDLGSRAAATLYIAQFMFPDYCDPETELGKTNLVVLFSVAAFLLWSQFMYQGKSVSKAHASMLESARETEWYQKAKQEYVEPGKRVAGNLFTNCGEGISNNCSLSWASALCKRKDKQDRVEDTRNVPLLSFVGGSGTK